MALPSFEEWKSVHGYSALKQLERAKSVAEIDEPLLLHCERRRAVPKPA
jgi:hypothetical protein